MKQAVGVQNIQAQQAEGCSERQIAQGDFKKRPEAKSENNKCQQATNENRMWALQGEHNIFQKQRPKRIKSGQWWLNISFGCNFKVVGRVENRRLRDEESLKRSGLTEHAYEHSQQEQQERSKNGFPHLDFSAFQHTCVFTT